MNTTEQWIDIIRRNTGISEQQFVQAEYEKFLFSKKRRKMLLSRQYYLGNQQEPKHLVYTAKDTMQDASGIIPNNKIINNLFDDLVDQKTNYLLSQQIDTQTDDDIDVTEYFNPSFQNLLKELGKDVYQCSIGYLHPYIDEQGNLSFKRFKPENVIPFWHDEAHKQLDAFIHFYDVEIYQSPSITTTETHVEYYLPEGVHYYIYSNGQLAPDTSKLNTAYIHKNDISYNWTSVPLIWFKPNSDETFLLDRIKTLQDALNQMISNFANVMSQDVHNTILVLKGYDGTNLEEFRHNLAKHGVIKISSTPEVQGDVEALNVSVDATNYTTIIKELERAIITNGRGFDAKDDRMANNPNQMNINSMYSDIDLDANDLEAEFQASLHHLVDFINAYRSLNSLPIINSINFIFNRDLPVNQQDTINAIKDSVGILSERTLVANHPFTLNVDEELEQIKKERQETLNQDYTYEGN